MRLNLIMTKINKGNEEIAASELDKKNKDNFLNSNEKRTVVILVGVVLLLAFAVVFLVKKH